jgi:hypothetical protein
MAGLHRDARVQREAGTLGHLPARLVRLRRQRLQREDLLPLSRTRRDPVRDRRAEQTSAALRLPELIGASSPGSNVRYEFSMSRVISPDEFRKVDGKWLIAKREVSTSHSNAELGAKLGLGPPPAADD